MNPSIPDDQREEHRFDRQLNSSRSWSPHLLTKPQFRSSDLATSSETPLGDYFCTPLAQHIMPSPISLSITLHIHFRFDQLLLRIFILHELPLTNMVLCLFLGPNSIHIFPPLLPLAVLKW